ncbi:DUF6461 domain-containing protein [Streptomyces acidicola]|uniref:DUF6461 domain-containing protein n=1 Tax=Streptomyces acidicola TaxID=2596892 RepID=UPI003442F211
MSDALTPYRWLGGFDGPMGEIFTVSFLHRLDPAEVLRCFVASTGELMDFEELSNRTSEYFFDTGGGEGGGHIGVMRAGEWSVAIELWGWQATLSEIVSRLSFAGEVVAITRHDYAEDSFVYALDGTVVTDFIPRLPSIRHGSEPDRLDALMREVGLESKEDKSVEDSVAAAFALAARMTGVAFTPSILTKSLLVGGIGN